MFDWIGDAIDWIGDGISSLWDDTVGSAASAVTEAVWDMMFSWLFETVYGCFSDFFEFINSTTSNIFTLAWVQTFISLFASMGQILFVCGFIVAVFDCAVAYENGGANIKNTAINIFKGFMAAYLFADIPPKLYALCCHLQGSFAGDLVSAFTGAMSSDVSTTAKLVLLELSGNATLFNLVFIILIGYCTVKIVFANIKRGGILLCQIAVGSLYMFGVPRGFTDGFYGWCKQVIATCLTTFLQTTILYLGLLTYTAHPLIAIGLCLSATEVPRVAQMYGLETSVKVNMTSISQTVSLGSKAAGLIKAVK
ncbi:hypothetical protein SAMN02910447_03146 [Ruminococcus sp. YE71]|uniref:conjugal transfer protein TrbL family protein n=1 Tax=unclassified Ruminococcus TaxID=2608920 RepID=UPI000880AD0D|nr:MULTISPECIES: conjugal transfer protein TrbL family protein [unclassified Ruminococcus]SDA30221.1 hypothetical protein SAMN02910446_03217 [Ruminococcus sp. YE78]SFW49267.1 hypothetical protein SAMN02910447_03146 [Ruminococcus sp. YE71]